MQRALHVTAEQCGFCVDVLARQTPLRPTHIAALVTLGAVYAGQTSRTAERLRDVRACVRTGDYLRINSTNPRRYRPRERVLVIAETDDYVVLDKPAGIPCGPTGDNALDNVLYHLAAEDQRPYDQRYYSLPHRLDADTTGVLVVAKSRAFARHMGTLIQARDPSVTKTYRAIVATVGQGADALHRRAAAATDGTVTLTHHTQKKVFTAAPFLGSLPCLSVLRSRSPPATRPAAMWVAFADALPRTPSHRRLQQAVHWWAVCAGTPMNQPLTLWDIEIRLVTGRTHQCRGQMHCEQLHIAGDNTYRGATSSASTDRYRSSPFLALQVRRMSE